MLQILKRTFKIEGGKVNMQDRQNRLLDLNNSDDEGGGNNDGIKKIP